MPHGLDRRSRLLLERDRVLHVRALSRDRGRAAGERNGRDVEQLVHRVDPDDPRLADYRALTDVERTEAAGVFGKSIDLDKVKLAVKSLPVDLIETLNGGRTFTTMYLLNFASWDKITLDTLIHELTHVWQGLQEGPVYMIEALEAQLIGAGYNYGYAEDADGKEFGTGAENALAAGGGDLAHFNEEQQAQVIMHYHARKTAAPPRDVAAWQPYANVVFA